MAEIKNSQKFKTVTTNLGRNAVALAHGSGTSVRLTHMAVGDGKGKEIEPIATMTELVHEVHRGAINDIIILEDKPGEFIAELLIPQNIGGFFIREVGLFLEDGTLFAIGSTPLTEKTEISSGAASDLLVRMIIRIIDSGVIEIVIDPTQVLATRDYVDRSIQKSIDNHNKDENAHKSLFDTIKGLITSAGQSMQTHLTDPNAHKGLFDAIKGQISAIPKISLANIISSTDTTKAVTGKAVADYAAGKDVDNVFTKLNTFNLREVRLKSPELDIITPPANGKTSTLGAYRIFDKRGNMIGEFLYQHASNNARSVSLTNSFRKHFNPDTGANPQNKYLAAKMGLTVDADDYAYGYCPSPKTNQIGDYIATTKWVRDYGQAVKKIGERKTSGNWVLQNLIPYKPIFIICSMTGGTEISCPIQHTDFSDRNVSILLGTYNGTKNEGCTIIPKATTLSINITGTDNTLIAYQ